VTVFGFFACVTLAVSAFMLAPIVQQARTSAWTGTQGEVTHSSMTVTRDAGGNTHSRATVWYAYGVGPRRYTCGTISLGTDLLGAGEEYARGVLDEFPVGPVTVWYNPQRPDEAVVRPGMTQLHWAETLLGLLPASVSAAFIAGMIGAVGRLRPGLVCGREVLNPAPDVYVLQSAMISPPMAALLAVPATVFAGMLVVAVLRGNGVNTGFVPLIATLCAVPPVALLVYRARERWVAQGRRSLVIDGREGLVLLPRSGRSTVPTLSVHDARAAVENQRSSVGTPTVVWNVWLTDAPAGQGRYLIGQASPRSRAEELAEWLNLRLAEAREAAPRPVVASDAG
jgi:hypothetical protein